MATIAESPRSRRASPLVRWRFWFYGVLFLLVLLVLWWDRETRRAEFEARGESSRGARPAETSGR